MKVSNISNYQQNRPNFGAVDTRLTNKLLSSMTFPKKEDVFEALARKGRQWEIDNAPWMSENKIYEKRNAKEIVSEVRKLDFADDIKNTSLEQLMDKLERSIDEQIKG